MKRRSALLSLATLPAWAGATEAGLWAARFPRPEGGELVLQNLRGRPLLVNFWATWCAPCVRELPEINDFAKAQPTWQVVGLAVDGPTPVREFLAKRPVGFAIGLAGLNGSELARSLGNKGGGMPFSLALDRRGEIVWRKLGMTSRAELDALAERVKNKG